MKIVDDIATTDPHEYYEELSAMASAGQLSGAEALELSQHLSECLECRESVQKFTFLCVQVLPNLTRGESLPAGMTGRFIARARAVGISISNHMEDQLVPVTRTAKHRDSWKPVFWVAAAASLLLIGVFLALWGRWLAVAPTAPAQGAQTQIMQLKQDLERVRAEVDARRATSNIKETELSSLQTTIEDQKHELDEMRRLNASEKLAGDLLGARNLRVLDIFPRDQMGKPTHEFGRLFLAEGKKLKFYAFDLSDPAQPHTGGKFYVWGERHNIERRQDSQIVALGKLTIESVKDNRWVLTVGDPNALAGLSYVFVTVESSARERPSPTSTRMLFAPLDIKEIHH